MKFVVLALLLLVVGSHVQAQKKVTRRTPSASTNDNQLSKLRDDYVKASKDYKASLEKLIPLYEASQKRFEQRLVQSKQLFDQGLISKRELEETERAATEAKAKVDETRLQLAGADAQIAGVLVEVESEKQLAKTGRVPRGGMVRTTSFIRFNGASAWSLADAGQIENFFQQRFGRQLPIAVFGQGAIHNRWRLDHHNAMDVNLHPDSAEGQALMQFLTNNGIPFSAFRSAIPGTATGPHIHVGRPSHRY